MNRLLLLCQRHCFEGTAQEHSQPTTTNHSQQPLEPVLLGPCCKPRAPDESARLLLLVWGLLPVRLLLLLLLLGVRVVPAQTPQVLGYGWRHGPALLQQHVGHLAQAARLALRLQQRQDVTCGPHHHIEQQHIMSCFRTLGAQLLNDRGGTRYNQEGDRGVWLHRCCMPGHTTSSNYAAFPCGTVSNATVTGSALHPASTAVSHAAAGDTLHACCSCQCVFAAAHAASRQPIAGCGSACG